MSDADLWTLRSILVGAAKERQRFAVRLVQGLGGLGQEDHVPLRVGRYRVDLLLGEGGMGQVFRAYDEVLHRHVALKILHTEAAAAREQTLSEARMAAALDHPNVVAIYDVGEHENAPYIVMEYVTGASLRTHVGDANVPIARRMRWLLDVARALGAAHRARLIHGDVKPENVMIREDGIAKVLDFGIARRKTGLTLPGTRQTGAHVAGTPAYMAPERLRGDIVDARADQFAWGVVAYELLTGRLPWGDGISMATLLARVMASQPAPLDPQTLGLEAGILEALARTLKKLPDERFPTMEALVQAIRAASSRPFESAAPPALAAEGSKPPGEIGNAPTLSETMLVHIPTQGATPPPAAGSAPPDPPAPDHRRSPSGTRAVVGIREESVSPWSATASVLLVDHDPVFLKTTAALLGDEIQVTTAGSADEALSSLSTTVFDVLCTELALPGTSGLELMKRANVIQPDIGGVLVTGHREFLSTERIEGLSYGVVLKPYRAEELLERVTQAARHARLRRSLRRPGT